MDIPALPYTAADGSGSDMFSEMPESAAPGEQARMENACIDTDLSEEFILTMDGLNCNAALGQRKTAFRFFVSQLTLAYQRKQVQMQGTLQTLVLLPPAMSSKQIRLIFKDVPEQDLRRVVIPALQVFGDLERIKNDRAEADRKRAEKRAQKFMHNAAALGDVDECKSLVQQLMKMRPEGGAPHKARTFIDNMANKIDRCERIAAHGLRQLTEDCRDAAEEDQ